MRSIYRAIAAGVCGTLGILAIAPAAFAAPAQPLSDYTIASWSRRDGIAAPIWSICQDKDGYLWIGTGSGLVRFDGHRFVRWESLGYDPLPGTAILGLLSAKDGSLWIGAGETGIGRLLNGKFTFYRDPQLAFTRTFFQDSHDNIWAGSRVGLYLFDGTRWVRQGEAVGLPVGPNNGIYESPTGELWVVTMQGVYRRAPSQKLFEHIPNPAALPNRTRTQRLAEALASPPGTRPMGVFRDSRGDLWVPSLGQGLTHARLVNGVPSIEQATTESGLSSNVIGALYEDRESNIWVGTQAALHELTPRKVTPVDDLGGVTVVRTTRDGSTWFGSDQGLIRVTKDRRTIYTERDGLPAGRIWGLGVDSQDRLWITTDRGGLARFYEGRFAMIMSAERRLARITSISIDSSDTAWITDYQFGVMRLQNGALTPIDAVAHLDGRRPIRAYVDHADRVWLGFSDGQIGLLERDGRLSMHTLGIAGAVSVFHEDQDGALWLGGEDGIARFMNGKAVALTNDKNDFPGSHITAIVDDVRGGIWAGTNVGIVRVDRSEFDAVASTPTHAVRYRLYDETDGLQGMPGALSSPAAARGSDGRLWFVTDSGATVVDPASLPSTRSAPRVRIEDVHVGGARFDPAARFRIPPRPERLDVEYTALTFASPASARFRYRLSGFDSEWQDAGTRRQASYTNLPPGNYTFQVVAVDKEGSFDPAGAALTFAIDPAFYQTTWFALLVAAAVIALGTAAWRLRVRQIRDRVSLVFAERARISREVHDTLLQSLVGVAVRSGTVARRLSPSDSTGAREELNRMRKEVEEQIREVRQTILNLRSPTLHQRGLAGALKDAGERIEHQTSAAFTFNIVGQPQQCAPVVEEQLLRIGQEALINAGRHSRASEIRAELSYDDGHVTLSVVDNGVGFDVDDAAAGHADDHFGLVHMQERAVQAGGQVDVTSAKGSGTRVIASFPRESRGAA